MRSIVSRYFAAKKNETFGRFSGILESKSEFTHV